MESKDDGKDSYMKKAEVDNKLEQRLSSKLFLSPIFIVSAVLFVIAAVFMIVASVRLVDPLHRAEIMRELVYQDVNDPEALITWF